LQGIRDKTKPAKSNLIKGDVQREKIDFYDLRESGAAANESKRLEQ